MKIKILKPEKLVFEGEIQMAQLPGSDGSFGIMNSHAPMVASLGKGKIRVIVEDGNTSFFDINGGVVEVKNNEILVLAE